jgi:hypothetical protein
LVHVCMYLYVYGEREREVGLWNGLNVCIDECLHSIYVYVSMSVYIYVCIDVCMYVSIHV